MIHNLKPYPAYKDSGVPWLGEVPAHWEVRIKIKGLASRLQDLSQMAIGLRASYITPRWNPWHSDR